MDINRDKSIELFKKLIGSYAWGVENGVGTFLDIEFGEPTLFIRQPRDASHVTGRLKESYGRRLVRPKGVNGIILLCDWFLKINGVDEVSSQGEIKKESISKLDGQALVSVERSETDDGIIFKFDLGAELKINDTADSDDQWLLTFGAITFGYSKSEGVSWEG